MFHLACKEGSPEEDYQDMFFQLCQRRKRQARSCPTQQQKTQNSQTGSAHKVHVAHLVTHNPQAIKFHGVIIEFLDFSKPPVGCGRSQEVGEGRVRPVQLWKDTGPN